MNDFKVEILESENSTPKTPLTKFTYTPLLKAISDATGEEIMVRGKSEVVSLDQVNKSISNLNLAMVNTQKQLDLLNDIKTEIEKVL